ncbi:unnamed protein product [Hermetia illucens]|uniref:RNA-directed DNA polymerase n=1 Tax=Hermetia illucens TaxID=343691 RepID=A0A7R8UKL7_HERIL|nr:unnamed protein product [Hermetia illucens]
MLRRYIPEKGKIGIYCKLNDHMWNKIQLVIISLYSNNIKLKFLKCIKYAIDLLNEDQCYQKIKQIHENGNHRGINENFEEIKNLYHYNGIYKLLTKYTNNCEICNLVKYDRHPVKPKFKLTETPSDINQTLHIDIFFIGKKQFLTSIDKFSKHLYTKETLDKNAITFINLIRERNANLGKPQKIIAKNEFNLINVKDYLRSENIEVHFTSPNTHTGNSDMNSCHKTLIDQIRVLTLTNPEMNITEKILKATEHYNNTIHSTTGYKPIEIQEGLHNKNKISQQIKRKKLKWIEYQNKNRELEQDIRHNRVFIKNYANERHKEEPKFRKVDIIKNENNEIILTKNNKPRNKIHPVRIKRIKKFMKNPEPNHKLKSELKTEKASEYIITDEQKLIIKHAKA